MAQHTSTCPECSQGFMHNECTAFSELTMEKIHQHCWLKLRSIAIAQSCICKYCNQPVLANYQETVLLAPYDRVHVDCRNNAIDQEQANHYLTIECVDTVTSYTNKLVACLKAQKWNDAKTYALLLETRAQSITIALDDIPG